MTIKTRLTINVSQQLDPCGDKFLNKRNFEIEFFLPINWGGEVQCTIDGKENCLIKCRDLITLLAFINSRGEERC